MRSPYLDHSVVQEGCQPELSKYLTRVETSEGERNTALIFGNPVKIKEFIAGVFSCFFSPRQIFSIKSTDITDLGKGVVVYVLEAKKPGDKIYEIPGITPGAEVLLEAKGRNQVSRALKWIESCAKDLDPATISPEIFRLADLKIRVRQRKNPRVRLMRIK